MNDIIISRVKNEWPDADVTLTFIKEASYGLEVATSAFQGLSRLSQQKMLMALFSEEFRNGELHALTLKTIAK